MRIGIDASSILSGGGVTHLFEVLKAAAAFDSGIDQVTVWAGQDTLVRMPGLSGVNLVHVPVLDQSLAARVYWQRTKLSDLAEQTCDLLFVPSGTYSGSFRPFVTMSHNLLPFEIDERRRFGASWQRIRLNLLERVQSRTFRKADGIIFLNDYARKVVEKTTGPLAGKVATIPHGVSQRFFREPRAQKSIAEYSWERPFRWLYVSTVNYYKHQWHVAEAVARLRESGYPIALDLVGSAYGPALTRLRTTMQQVDPQGAFIQYHGVVNYSVLDQHYAAADGFVFASSCENMPNIVLEAMAASLPIASSDRGPMPEILADGARYFDPQKPDDIARSMQLMLDDADLRATLATTAYQNAHSYSWDSTARQTFAFFADVANGS